MASASEIEKTLVVNIGNFERIQNFLNDKERYKEILENSENFNTRLCIERRLRMPFLDPQTGVAQTHCALFMKKKQRMPGFRHGQIYTYPSTRWRKPKRQYLLNPNHSYRAYQYREHHLSHSHHQQHQQHHHHHVPTCTVSVRDHHQTESAAIAATDGNSMGASGDNDSKDSHANAEKEWFHDEIDSSHYHHGGDDYEDDFDSDNDFDESYSNRGKRKRSSRPRRSNANVEGTPKRGRKGGGSRRKNTADGETDRRRRGGGNSGNTSAAAAAAAAAVAHAANTAAAAATGLYTSHSNSASPIPINDETSQSALVMPTNIASSYDKTLSDAGASNDSIPLATMAGIAGMGIAATSNVSAGPPIYAAVNPTVPAPVVASVASPKKLKLRVEREVAQPSPYCDFCLGDQRENKKTNMPEELVSCSDCGRSGHPSCLQFTANMIISVKRYRWQCIECKYCSICGTSDNDDQLLFCDDCDRGYHMYCLSPPLVTPPEGSWSCKLCMEEFHKNK
ncbi:zinc finger protein DPF3 [Drosophila persimilis]|uniref:Zinc finger protein DPF3 n=3 Tax=pseudoobscura subgroup TaxID=32358 RepID=A0A6I8ULN6_DROPS|nr:zinc finger protein DPF3 [Drosophila pseudoobscura]XP_026841164.1 zinc finger protein DPF3 [Drosophila persimilis]